MGNITVTLFGVGICCIAPLAMFAAGVYYARFGLPLAVRWRGFATQSDDEE